MRKRFIFRLIVSLMMVLCGTVDAGLDHHGRFDEVIAIYRFENKDDSGPREYNGQTIKGATLANNGKNGKCLKLVKDSTFGSIEDFIIGIVGNFSITAWIKTNKVTGSIVLDAGDSDISGFSSIALSIEKNKIYGLIHDSEDDETDGVVYENHSVGNNKWHHIAFSLTEDFYRIFIDGKIVEEKRNEGYTGFVGRSCRFEGQRNCGSHILIWSQSNNPVYVDEVGFFETGFSVFEVQGLYKQGLTRFLEAMPVDNREKVTTTWGNLKKMR